MRRGTAVRKSVVSFVQVQADYSREEYGELRNAFGNTRIVWDKVHQVLSIGEEGKFRARPGDFIVFPDTPGLTNFEVIREVFFNNDFINVEDAPASAPLESGIDREMRQRAGFDQGDRIGLQGDRQGDRTNLQGNENFGDNQSGDPNRNHTDSVDPNFVGRLSTPESVHTMNETDEQKRARESKAFEEQNRSTTSPGPSPVGSETDAQRIARGLTANTELARGDAPQNIGRATVGSPVPANPLLGTETEAEKRARLSQEAIVRAKGLVPPKV